VDLLAMNRKDEYLHRLAMTRWPRVDPVILTQTNAKPALKGKGLTRLGC